MRIIRRRRYQSNKVAAPGSGDLFASVLMGRLVTWRTSSISGVRYPGRRRCIMPGYLRIKSCARPGEDSEELSSRRLFPICQCTNLSNVRLTSDLERSPPTEVRSPEAAADYTRFQGLISPLQHGCLPAYEYELSRPSASSRSREI
jgi:hypothetical protein